MSEAVTLATAIVGAVTGVCGASLGIWSTWHNWRSSQPRMAIRVGWTLSDRTHPIKISDGIEEQNTEPDIFVEAINLTPYPIYIREFGLSALRKPSRRRTINDPCFSQAVDIEVAPRQAVRRNFQPNVCYLPGRDRPAATPYVETACGKRFFGSRKRILELLPILDAQMDQIKQELAVKGATGRELE
jgi:hypothetical protein